MGNIYGLCLVAGIVAIGISIFQHLFVYLPERVRAEKGLKMKGPVLGRSILRIGLLVGVACFLLAGATRHFSVEPASITMGDEQSLQWCRDNGSGNCLKSECEAYPTTVVYFRAGWCGYCRKMESGTFRDKRVMQELEKRGRVYADSKEAGELFSLFRIRGFPTVVVLDAECREKGRIRGYNDPDEFLKNLRAIR